MSNSELLGNSIEDAELSVVKKEPEIEPVIIFDKSLISTDTPYVVSMNARVCGEFFQDQGMNDEDIFRHKIILERKRKKPIYQRDKTQGMYDPREKEIHLYMDNFWKYGKGEQEQLDLTFFHETKHALAFSNQEDEERDKKEIVSKSLVGAIVGMCTMIGYSQAFTDISINDQIDTSNAADMMRSLLWGGNRSFCN